MLLNESGGQWSAEACEIGPSLQQQNPQMNGQFRAPLNLRWAPPPVEYQAPAPQSAPPAGRSAPPCKPTDANPEVIGKAPRPASDG
jgi:hypothetical protein